MSHGGLGIGHLVDVEPIAVGERRDLFAATDLKLERRVAVRILPPIAGVEERTRFLDGARLLAAVSGHPNVVRVYDVGINPDGRPYLVLELTEGPDLGRWLASRGPLPWPQAVGLALQLAAGLAQVHRVGWLHHDLRPANVLLAGPTPKLSDVGLLPTVTGPTDDPAVVVHRAPETFGGEWDARSDLYSLTSILHQMIDGHPAHWRPDDTVVTLQHRITSQVAPHLDPDMAPAVLRVFVTAGLSADPLDRPQDTAEFIRELELIRQGRTTGSTPSLLYAGSTTSTIALAHAGGLVDDRPHGLPGGPADGLADDRTVVAWPPPSSQQPRVAEAESGTAIHDVHHPDLLDVHRPGPVDHRPPESLDRASVDVLDRAPVGGPHRGAAGRSPLVLGAAAMIAVGLIGLVAVIALGLRGSGDDEISAAPLFPDPNAQLAADGSIDGSASGELAPLAMLQESTTTTVSSEAMSTTEPPPTRATVPQLVGLDVEVAGQRLTDAGFDVLVVGRVSPGSLPGTVIEQTPAAGSQVELPLSVTLFIPRSATLPAMVGRPANSVCLQLAALDLTCEQTLQFDDRVPAGAVVSTDPVEGTSFTPGSAVKLRVSRGPLVDNAVPQVAGQSEQEARATLGEAGFLLIAVTTMASDNVPAGQAIGTDPSNGTRLSIDQTVTITISSGPTPRVIMPGLIGLDRAAAEAELAKVQLTATFTNRNLPAGDPGVGKVVATDPNQGAELPAGTTVTVAIGAAPAPPGSTTSSTVANGDSGDSGG